MAGKDYTHASYRQPLPTTTATSLPYTHNTIPVANDSHNQDQ
jgi:hypothetical protein